MATPTIYYTTTSSLSLDTPTGLAIDNELNRILVSDTVNNRLVLYNIDGFEQVNTISSYDSNDFSAPAGICYYNGYFYVCDSSNHTIVRLRARDLQYKDHFGTVGTSGSTNALLSTPWDITHDKNYLYITDSGNSRIMKLNIRTLTYSAKTSNINGAFGVPRGITYKKDGGEALFISDYSTGRIVKCKTDFTYIEQNSSTCTNPGNMCFVNDSLHVSCGVTGDDTIQILTSDGLASASYYQDTTITLDSPRGIKVYKDSIIIADSNNDRLTVWRAYNALDSITSTTTMKFGGRFYNNPFIILGKDSLVIGDTQESDPNYWIEEQTNNYSSGWVKE